MNHLVALVTVWNGWSLSVHVTEIVDGDATGPGVFSRQGLCLRKKLHEAILFSKINKTLKLVGHQLEWP